MPHSPFARPISRVVALPILFVFSFLLCAQTPPSQNPPPPTTAEPAQGAAKQGPASPSPAPAPGNNAELSTQDHAATFRVRVNLVLVRVVVRDQKGNVVTNLHREDFQLSDNRKPQVITSFSAETPESQALKSVSTTSPETPPSEQEAAQAAAAARKLPQRFVSILFDDVHLSQEDAIFVRKAATRLFDALAPSDRVGIFSSSGQFKQPFTSDRELLAKSLLSIVPHPVSGAAGYHDCPDVSYYEADQIENVHDTQALSIATEDAVQCAFGGDETQVTAARGLAEGSARRALSQGDEATEFAYRHLEDAMRQLASMPGQRIMVFVSPGFIPSTLWSETSDLIDRASRVGIVINTIDARGLYAPDILGDISDPPRGSPLTQGYKGSYRMAAQFAQDQVMQQLAYGTGGTFFHNRNDVDEGLRQAVAAPPLSYVLGFSPQNMKYDGRLHTLKVTLTNKQKYSLQTRNGYYAPKTIPNPAEAAKEEIREAIFSQDELHDMPVDLQTQFFKTDASSARLSVLTHLDLKGIHFRKAEGRNHEDLTIATAIFDDNGNFVTGGEKIVQMKLLDTTYDRLARSGLTLKSSYDVKPGTYMVRLVVRDGEGSQMAARNGAVVIPF